MNRWLAVLLACFVALVVACGGGSSGSPTASPSTNGTPSLSPLQASLASVLLQPADLPEGMEGGSPEFSTNEDLAGSDQNQLATLTALGRQLGANIQYIPTDRLDPSTPVRGVQTSASVYTTPSSASQTFQDTAQQASTSDWKATYPEIPDLAATSLTQQIGDESLWIRLTGTAQCTFIDTPAPGSSPTPTCGDTKLLVVDNLIFRSGRVRGYIQVSSLFPPNTPHDAFVAQVASWAQLVVQRAQTAFPG